MKWNRWFALLPSLLGFLIYTNTINHDFALDDKAIITKNKFTQQGVAGIGNHLTNAYWAGLADDKGAIYRPITPMVFATIYQFAQLNPSAYHLVNILCYGLLCYLIFLLLSLLLPGSPWIPFVLSILFASQPIHTEVVANIKSLDEILSLTFLVMAFIFLSRAEHQKNVILSTLFFGLALLSKESAIAGLGILGASILLRLTNQKNGLKTLAAWSITSIVWLSVYFQITDVDDVVTLHLFDNALVQEASNSDLFATKIMLVGNYLWKLIWPLPLSYDYSYNQLPLASFGDLQVLTTATIILAVVIFSLKQILTKTTSKNYALLAFGLVWIAASLTPVSNIFFLVGATFAERFLFAPSLGLLIVLGALVLIVQEKKPKLVSPTLLGIIAVSLTFSAFTFQRNPDWHDDHTLFLADIEKVPQSAKAHHNLSNTLQEKSDASTDATIKNQLAQQSIQQLERALAIYEVQEFRNDLAQRYGALGNMAKATEHLVATLNMNRNQPNAWMQLGIAYGMQQQMPQAQNAFETAIQLDPNQIEARENLAKTYAMQGQLEKARTQLIILLQQQPNKKSAQELLQRIEGDLRR